MRDGGIGRRGRAGGATCLDHRGAALLDQGDQLILEPGALDQVQRRAALELVEPAWFENELIPVVQQRGAAVIKARGASSAASAANAAIAHMRSWALGTPADDWVSMGVYSDGSYGIPEGLIYSFPCVCSNGDWRIVTGLSINEFSRGKMTETANELGEERDAVRHLLP